MLTDVDVLENEEMMHFMLKKASGTQVVSRKVSISKHVNEFASQGILTTFIYLVVWLIHLLLLSIHQWWME